MKRGEEERRGGVVEERRANNASGVECYESNEEARATGELAGATALHRNHLVAHRPRNAEQCADSLFDRLRAAPSIRRALCSSGCFRNHQLWSQNTAKIKFIGMERRRGLESSRARNRVNVFTNSATARKTIPVLERTGAKDGARSRILRSRTGKNEPEAQGRRSDRSTPDWVIDLARMGRDESTALKAAVENRLPAYKLVGSVWSGAEET